MDNAKKGDLLKLPVEAISRNWDSAVAALDKMLGVMRADFGCVKFEFIPSMDIISPLCVILFDIKFNRYEHFEDFKKLYWNLVFSLYLSSAPESKSSRIVREWRESVFDARDQLNAEALRMFSLVPDDMREATRASAVYKGIISLIIANGARDFGQNYTKLSGPRLSIDDHHIFPQQFLKNCDIKGYIANGILNRTPLITETNQKIGSDAPEIYFSNGNMVGELGSSAENLERHGISRELVTSAFTKELFDRFCKDRQDRLVRMIEGVTGHQFRTDEVET